jgi:hypothetical protein
MDIHVSTGEWIQSLMQQMSGNTDIPTCFRLPSSPHVHAFLIVKESNFPQQPFTYTLEEVAAAK